ncbi:MAG TPA: TlpA disulfide reductase family protein [Burkholderiales bacterium]|nr:TlpA disulfide reductase family protein [Burkholderiales bacterium]
MKKYLGNLLVISAISLLFLYAYYPKHPDAGEKEHVEAILKASLPDLEGRAQALSQWQGKVMVVNFWASWCPPCRMEMPGFIDLQEKYGKEGLVFVGVAVDSPDKVADFAHKIGVNYPILVDQSSSLLNLSGLPFTAVFDRKGKLVASHAGAWPESNLDDIVSKLL